ncbi:putative leucine-rich repeat-containing protein DDB_G0290503 isoform X1 [Erpetoichthys calabaricus]|uniref:putative leucine-rich repeat-containing protein DDB_G0290503 isoform X1 n=1 Tax=Erpetoichthys calabaricus TaxID=27687 RepID=UPI00223464B4|nr:putative leucine-rich repeat-containing protein DDB_G0290503 isoform X1 [Erpetoichthys calabaricus]XP_028655004.2 putative leucine-rich repeat-containing protein DDB_G0290503 isoform X1 [Erpetoichthys calabaricus]XP_051779997.1 putative leucine-rich repeat-containing protein DDB_G0290503 isoform X1 [Erpetoichthys calabaricus]
MSLAEQSQKWLPTNVQVTVIQARGLRSKGKNGLNDAYSIIQMGKEKFSTSVAEKSLTPLWKEEASFELPFFHQGNENKCFLYVIVMHRALVGLDQFLGQAVINLMELCENKSRNKTEWFKLQSKPNKKEKERGEVQVDIQFMRNNMTASMFDLSVKDKSRSPFGKLKDKIKGKKDAKGFSDSASAIVPSVTQVLTDSEDDGEKKVHQQLDTKKKSPKIKSLFKPSSRLQRTSLSQSMSVLPTLQPLPETRSELKTSPSSELDNDSLNEVKSKADSKPPLNFLTHKRTQSSEAKQLQQLSGKKEPFSLLGGLRPKNDPVSRSNVCINGSHVYTEEPEVQKPSLTGSLQNLSKSACGSVENIKDKTSSSESLKSPAVHSYKGNIGIAGSQEEEKKMEEKLLVEDKFKDDERKKKTLEVRGKEDGARQEEEEVRKMQEAKRVEEVKREEERRRMEEERRRLEEAKREEEERRRLEEAKREEERRRLEEAKREEERRRLEEAKRDEERRRMEEARREEERRRMEEVKRMEEKKKMEEEKNKGEGSKVSTLLSMVRGKKESGKREDSVYPVSSTDQESRQRHSSEEFEVLKSTNPFEEPPPKKTSLNPFEDDMPVTPGTGFLSRTAKVSAVKPRLEVSPKAETVHELPSHTSPDCTDHLTSPSDLFTNAPHAFSSLHDSFSPPIPLHTSRTTLISPPLSPVNTGFTKEARLSSSSRSSVKSLLEELKKKRSESLDGEDLSSSPLNPELIHQYNKDDEFLKSPSPDYLTRTMSTNPLSSYQSPTNILDQLNLRSEIIPDKPAYNCPAMDLPVSDTHLTLVKEKNGDTTLETAHNSVSVDPSVNVDILPLMSDTSIPEKTCSDISHSSQEHRLEVPNEFPKPATRFRSRQENAEQATAKYTPKPAPRTVITNMGIKEVSNDNLNKPGDMTKDDKIHSINVNEIALIKKSSFDAESEGASSKLETKYSFKGLGRDDLKGGNIPLRGKKEEDSSFVEQMNPKTDQLQSKNFKPKDQLKELGKSNDEMLVKKETDATGNANLPVKKNKFPVLSSHTVEGALVIPDSVPQPDIETERILKHTHSGSNQIYSVLEDSVNKSSSSVISVTQTLMHNEKPVLSSQVMEEVLIVKDKINMSEMLKEASSESSEIQSVSEVNVNKTFPFTITDSCFSQQHKMPAFSNNVLKEMSEVRNEVNQTDRDDSNLLKLTPSKIKEIQSEPEVTLKKPLSTTGKVHLSMQQNNKLAVSNQVTNWASDLRADKNADEILKQVPLDNNKMESVPKSGVNNPSLVACTQVEVTTEGSSKEFKDPEEKGVLKESRENKQLKTVKKHVPLGCIEDQLSNDPHASPDAQNSSEICKSVGHLDGKSLSSEVLGHTFCSDEDHSLSEMKKKGQAASLFKQSNVVSGPEKPDFMSSKEISGSKNHKTEAPDESADSATIKGQKSVNRNEFSKTRDVPFVSDKPVDPVPSLSTLSPITSDLYTLSPQKTNATEGHNQPVTSRGKKVLKAMVLPSETQPIVKDAATEATESGPVTGRRRPHPVKPLSSQESQKTTVIMMERDLKNIGVHEDIRGQSGLINPQVTNTADAAPYSQLTREELVALVVKQKGTLAKKDVQIRELEDYIDNLLVRVMEATPNILRSQPSKQAGRV